MKRYPTIWQSITLLLYIIPLSLILVLPVLVLHLTQGTLLFSAAYIFLFGALVLIGLRKQNDSLSRAGFPLPVLFISFGFILSFHIALEPLSRFIPDPESVQEALFDMMHYPVLAFFVLVVFAPVLEEILFRGIILNGYLKNYSPAKSILISALLFALIHGNLAQGLGAFILGLLSGLVYWRTRSLFFCISLHFLNNLTAFLLAWLDPESIRSSQTIADLIGDDLLYGLLYGGSGIVLILCGFYVWRKYLEPARIALWIKPDTVDPKNVSHSGEEITT